MPFVARKACRDPRASRCRGGKSFGPASEAFTFGPSPSDFGADHKHEGDRHARLRYRPRFQIPLLQEVRCNEVQMVFELPAGVWSTGRGVENSPTLSK